MSAVELRNVSKSFQVDKKTSTTVLNDVSFRAESGEFLVILGPSGCGKSTSLRIVAGLESATSGEVLVDGRIVNNVPAAQRKIAMVFQNYALYPHLTVMENIIFGLRVRRVKKAERERLGREAAEKLGLEKVLSRKPAQLSGGQRQRAALGRALVTDAKVVLMDEPLSNLDAKLRHQMRLELRQLQQDLGLTVLYVTHDQVEAMTMADQVVVMSAGEVAQSADPVSLYLHPRTADVATFIGSPPMNIVPVRRVDGGLRIGDADTGQVVAVNAPDVAGDQLLLGFRPEAVRLGPGSGGVQAVATIVSTEVLGAETLITIELAPRVRVVVRSTGITLLEPGQRIPLRIAPEEFRYFDSDTRRALVADPVST